MSIACHFVLRRGTTHRGALAREEAVSGVSDGADETAPIWPGALQPGDVVVLPTDAGGVDEHGLAPLQPRGDATDIAVDLRPNDGLAPVRITPEALGQAIAKPLQKRRWLKIVDLCRKAEGRVTKASKAEDRQAVMDRLIVKLHELVPEHPAITLLAEDAPERTDQNVVLR